MWLLVQQKSKRLYPVFLAIETVSTNPVSLLVTLPCACYGTNPDRTNLETQYLPEVLLEVLRRNVADCHNILDPSIHHRRQCHKDKAS